jgi:hypothetical protein
MIHILGMPMIFPAAILPADGQRVLIVSLLAKIFLTFLYANDSNGPKGQR